MQPVRWYLVLVDCSYGGSLELSFTATATYPHNPRHYFGEQPEVVQRKRNRVDKKVAVASVTREAAFPGISTQRVSLCNSQDQSKHDH